MTKFIELSDSVIIDIDCIQSISNRSTKKGNGICISYKNSNFTNTTIYKNKDAMNSEFKEMKKLLLENKECL